MSIRELHREAMEIADRAYVAQKSGLFEEAALLFSDAYLMEIKAAELSTAEHSRSILYKSAMALMLLALRAIKSKPGSNNQERK